MKLLVKNVWDTPCSESVILILNIYKGLLATVVVYICYLITSYNNLKTEQVMASPNPSKL